MATVMQSRLLLMGLQCFVILAAIIFRSTPWTWVKVVCLGTFGVCSCHSDHVCWSDGMVYRVEASGFLCFLAISILAASGCGKQAQSSFFLGMLFVCFFAALLVFIFLPNSIFDGFGDFAVVASALFLVVQTLLVADWGYMASGHWMGAAVDARRRNFSSAPEMKLKIAYVVVSVLFLAAAVVGTIVLVMTFQSSGWVAVVTLVLSIILGFVSILECIKHGNLLTSCIVAAYEAWLTYEVLITRPNDGTNHRPAFFMFFGVALAAVTLLSASFHAGLGLAGPADEPILALEGGGGEVSSETTVDFIKQAVLHCCATLFIATEFAPKETSLGFTFRVIALVLSLLVYLCTLLAPVVFPDRF